MISKTKIKERLRKKTNPELAETIRLCNKNNLMGLGKKIAGPRRRKIIVNLNELNELKEEAIVIPGKVLSKGELNKKINVYALSFSKEAKEKLKKAGCVAKLIREGIEKKELKGVKIL